MKETVRACSGCREAPAKRGQWYCKACAAAASRRHRAKRRAEMEELRAAAGSLVQRKRVAFRAHGFGNRLAAQTQA